MKFNIICVPIAPSETTKQQLKQQSCSYKNTEIQSGNGTHKAADEKDPNGNTTTGSSVKGG